MSQNSPDEFELVFQGPVDDSPDTLRKLKASFLADLEFEISDIQKVLESAPTTILRSDNELQIKTICAKLKGAGAVVSILQPGGKELDHEEDSPEGGDGDEFAFEIAIDDLDPTIAVRRQDPTPVKTWSLDLPLSDIPEDPEPPPAEVPQEQDLESIIGTSLLNNGSAEESTYSIAGDEGNFEPSMAIDEDLDTSEDVFDLDEGPSEALEDEEEEVAQSEEDETDVDSLIEQMKPELSPHPPSIPDIFLKEPEGSSLEDEAAYEDKDSDRPTTDDSFEQLVDAEDEEENTSDKLVEKNSPKLSLALDDSAEESASDSDSTTPPEQEENVPPAKEFKTDTSGLSLELEDDESDDEEEEPVAKESEPAPTLSLPDEAISTPTATSQSPSGLRLDSDEDTEGLDEDPKPEKSPQKAKVPKDPEPITASHEEAPLAKPKRKKRTPQQKTKPAVSPEELDKVEEENDADIDFDSPPTTKRRAASKKKGGPKLPKQVYALIFAGVIFLGVNVFLMMSKEQPNGAVDVIAKVHEMTDASLVLERKQAKEKPGVKPEERRYVGKYTSRHMTFEASCIKDDGALSCSASFETPPPPELTPEEIVNGKVRAPWIRRVETLEVLAKPLESGGWQGEAPARTYVEYKDARKRIVSTSSFQITQDSAKPEELNVEFTLASETKPAATTNEVNIEAVTDKVFNLLIQRSIILYEDASYHPEKGGKS